MPAPPIGLTALVLLLTNALTLAQSPTTQPAIYGVDRVRGARYCEILVVTGPLTKLTASVYNTLGLNSCPASQWNALDPDKLKKDFSARSVVMNGPRVFMMDKIGQTTRETKTVSFDGLQMKKRAEVPVSLKTAREGKAKPYAETTVNRATQYVFNKGSRVYELISPQHSYIMQSYAQIIDPKLTEKDLMTLQTRLKLPKGWRYQMRVLAADLVLRTVEGGKAYVTQDDFQNTYQRVN
ncbi:hypothetical protein [Spirosoma spitsbergense]|jgi:haloalkane dehalogenase|uniref:hypothetical protein n=1 Tax=Spirosoma spitsbergense TaxID=431554 RepID=UPI000369CEB0|nr:hypothetical protein [Spirosoma spitsbergense]